VTRLLLIALFLLVSLTSASAYVDPGTGSMIIQVIIAGIVGAGAFLGVFWRKLFHRRRDPDDEPAGKSEGDG
jgi:hypothetical protein